MESLLKKAENDHMARLRHVVLGYYGICPLGLGARLISDREILRCAIMLALDADGDGSGGEFDMARFRAMKEGRI